ncbi:hypothetical protein HZB07_00935 [Candidatus Saganbacteria bacterium]|nr:hypothetical protein [Candidatus Saganbacteria bacterium]
MEKNIVFEIEYDKVLDVLKIYEKKHNPKNIDFFQFENLPIYVIAENGNIIGIEYFEYKKHVKEFYGDKKKEMGFKNQKQAEEFLRGSFYSFYRNEFSGGKITRMENRRIEIKNTYSEKKMLRNLEDLVPA